MEKALSITDYLKWRLRQVGAANFEEIARETGVTVSFIRKFVYGSRENPRVQTIQPLLDYFATQGGPANPAVATPDPPRDLVDRRVEAHPIAFEDRRRPSAEKAGA